MDRLILTKYFDFDSAHRLVGYEGDCNKIHGHRWKVKVFVKGERSQLDKVGILWDFKNIETIQKLFDHKIILKVCEENNNLIECIKKECGEDSVYLMKESPTTENLCYEIIEILELYYPELNFKVSVWESPDSKSTVLR